MKVLLSGHLKGKAAVFAALAPLFMMLEVLMDLMQPRMLESIIDIGVATGDLNYVFLTGGKMIAFAFIGLIGGVGCAILAINASVDFGTKLRQGMFDRIQTLSFLEIDHFQTSSLITRLTNDISQVQMMMMMILRAAVRSPLMCIGGIIFAFLTCPELAWIFLITLPIILLITILVLVFSFPLFEKVQVAIDRINTVMRENILGIRVIKALTIEREQGQKFDEVNVDLMEKNIRAQNRNMLLWPLVTLLMNVSVVAVLWIGGNMVDQGTLQVGKIMAFINYLMQITNSLIMMVNLILGFSRAKASADRVKEVLITEGSVQNQEETIESAGYDICFKDVTFQYNRNSEPVLQNIDLTIKEGERVAIMGTTGSGKSSLIQLIPRLYDVTNGEVLIGNVNVKELNLEVLRKQVGLVLQENILFEGTVEENIRYGNPDATKDELKEAACQAQALEFIIKKEDQFDTVVNQRGKNFSGGQKQRLSVARTLVRKPNILILDDASSALDVETEAKLQKAIRESMTKCTIIMVAQRVSAVMDADQIVILDDGKIESIGTHHELLKKSEIYRTIAVSQLGEEILYA